MELRDVLPSLDVPLFDCGTVYLCGDREKWWQTHEALGATVEMIGRRGAANIFKHTQGGKLPAGYLIVHLQHWCMRQSISFLIFARRLVLLLFPAQAMRYFAICLTIS